MKAIHLIAVSPIFLSGCATVLNDPSHPIKVEAHSADGQLVVGAYCKLVNDRGSFAVRSGEAAVVRRSDADLEITCSEPNNPDAKGRAISRANAGLFGNILIGGAIGAVVDHSRGTAYTYPTWMQLVFGQSLVFDRAAQKEGKPTPAVAAATGN